MKTNDLKKGTRIRLRNGWYGTMMDNMKGNSRVIDVEGDFREMGSCYTHDIVGYSDLNGNWFNDIEYTPSQLNCKKMNEAFWG